MFIHESFGVYHSFANALEVLTAVVDASDGKPYFAFCTAYRKRSASRRWSDFRPDGQQQHAASSSANRESWQTAPHAGHVLTESFCCEATRGTSGETQSKERSFSQKKAGVAK